VKSYRIVRVKKKMHACPKCGCRVLLGRSAQIGEDVCEMWYVCKDCGYDPTTGIEKIGHRVETVWGWQGEYAGDAFAVWVEESEADRKDLVALAVGQALIEERNIQAEDRR
jgi:predicted RNA-binding Zn-ribbon protein involved in translation (DUF1610 family)